MGKSVTRMGEHLPRGFGDFGHLKAGESFSTRWGASVHANVNVGTDLAG